MPDPATSTLYAEIDRHFLAPEALKRAALLGRVGPDVGGWFKAELAYVLDTLLKAGDLKAWRSNVPISEGNRQRIDFRIELASPSIPQGDPSIPQGDPSIPQGDPSIPQGERILWLEVKSIADPARTGPLADTAMFARGSAFTDDIVKLLRVPDGERGVLLFVYPKPDAGQWSELISSLARRIAPIDFTEESDLASYPPELYVCKLAVSGGF